MATMNLDSCVENEIKKAISVINLRCKISGFFLLSWNSGSTLAKHAWTFGRCIWSLRTHKSPTNSFRTQKKYVNLGTLLLSHYFKRVENNSKQLPNQFCILLKNILPNQHFSTFVLMFLLSFYLTLSCICF